MKKPIRFAPGFTLIEVMIVIVVLLILASVSTPMMFNMLHNYRLKKSADIIRAEWIHLRVKAMEDGKIYCFRTMLGGNRILVDQVLDVHFAASMRVDDNYDRNSVDGSPAAMEGDKFYSSGFTGDEGDFILRDPSQADTDSGARFIQLPEGVFFSDTLAVPDERAAYYLGYTVGDTEDRGSTQDPVLNRDTRFGETQARDGTTWSAPVFFFPDGTTSTAASLLKNQKDRCLEVRLRGLTGTATIGSISFPDGYIGELDPSTQGMSKMELDALPQVRMEEH